MTQNEIEFNLLREPWIMVMDQEGKTMEVGLIELFERAHQYRGLAGELPTQDIAVLRLLLAILHCVYGRYNPQGEYEPLYESEPGATPDAALKRWKEIWDKGAFSDPILREYLEHYEDRFWLFHPERPFYQVPEHKLKEGLVKDPTKYTAAKLNGEIAQSGNKLRLFSSRSGEAKEALSFAESARWLLHLNGFDDASVKPKGKDPEGGKLPSTGLGWLGKLGLVAAEGDNLFETLMLNFTLLRDGKSLWGPGEAVWELDTVRSKERSLIPQPENPAALLTLQSRRILLHRDGNKVVGYSLLGGDVFSEENAFVEQMTLWKKVQNKKRGAVQFIPKLHDPSRQLWREFAALFVNSEELHSPGVISWIRRLKFANYLSRTFVHFRIAAITYDASNSSFNDVFSDGISIHRDILESSEFGDRWIKRIIEEIETTDQLVWLLGQLAQDIAIATGASMKGDQNKKRLSRIAGAAREHAFYCLDQPFRRWLESIDPVNDEPHEASMRWWNEAKKIIRQLGEEMIKKYGIRAYGERIVKEDNKEVAYSIPQAYNRFLYRTHNKETLKGGKSA